METGPLGKAGDPVALESSQKVILLAQAVSPRIDDDPVEAVCPVLPNTVQSSRFAGAEQRKRSKHRRKLRCLVNVYKADLE